MSLIETIQKNLDDVEIAYGVLLDLQKAFDLVNHEIQVEKLNC